ncbi:hypothetical protein BSKO_00011 [Bryopsis sp. KO-2023]|nr:hypothetical protein BSKO_00011 [Bryopsis sp. KO-2023]
MWKCVWVLVVLDGVLAATSKQGGWQRLEVLVPDARAYHGATLGDDNRSLFIFGGHSQHYDRCLGDVWKLDTRTERWTRLHDDAHVGRSRGKGVPPPVMAHSLVFNREGPGCQEAGCLLSIGGRTDCSSFALPTEFGRRQSLGDLWQFSLKTLLWERIVVLSGMQPSSRSGHSAVRLQQGGSFRTLVFGGGNGQVLNTTHSLTFGSTDDGRTGVLWEELAPMPIKLQWHSSVQTDGMIYVFGGVTEGIYADHSPFSNRLFEYNATQNFWTELPRAQFPRGYHALFVAGSRLIAFGGQLNDEDVDKHFNTTSNELDPWVGMEIYDWTNKEWIDEETRRGLIPWRENLPPMTKGGTATAAQGKVFLIGDRKGVETEQEKYITYVLNPRNLTWRHLEPVKPAARADARLVQMEDGKLVLFGGASLQFYESEDKGDYSWARPFYFEKVWEYTEEPGFIGSGKWRHLVTKRPRPLPGEGHSLVAVNSTHLLLFGGYREQKGREGSRRDITNAVWSLHLEGGGTASWARLTNYKKHLEILQPQGRIRHSAVFFPGHGDGEGVMVVFGGVKSADSDSIDTFIDTNELWMFDVANGTWIPHLDMGAGEESPKARWHHACVKAGKSQMLCYGGFHDDIKELMDIWIFELEPTGYRGKWTKILSTNKGPGARAYFSLTALPDTSDMFVLFGGESKTRNGRPHRHHDTWILQVACGKAYWQEVFPNPPDSISAHFDHSAAFLSAGDFAVFGGQEWTSGEGGLMQPAINDWLWRLPWKECLSDSGRMAGTCPVLLQVPDACLSSTYEAIVRVHMVGDSSLLSFNDFPAPAIEDDTGSTLSYRSVEYFQNATWVLRGIQMREPTISGKVIAQIQAAEAGESDVVLKAGSEVSVQLRIDPPQKLVVKVLDSYRRTGITKAQVDLFVVNGGEASRLPCHHRNSCGRKMTSPRGTVEFGVFPMGSAPLPGQHYLIRAALELSASETEVVVQKGKPLGRTELVLSAVKASEAQMINVEEPGSNTTSIQVLLSWASDKKSVKSAANKRNAVSVFLFRLPQQQQDIWRHQEPTDDASLLHYPNAPFGSYFVRVVQEDSGAVVSETQVKTVSNENKSVHFAIKIELRKVAFRTQFTKVGNGPGIAPANAVKIQIYYNHFKESDGRLPKKNLVVDRTTDRNGYAKFSGLMVGIDYTAVFTYSPDIKLREPIAFRLDEGAPEKTIAAELGKVLLCKGQVDVVGVQPGEMLPIGALPNTIYSPGTNCAWEIRWSEKIKKGAKIPMTIDYTSLGKNDVITVRGGGLPESILRDNSPGVQDFHVLTGESLRITFRADDGKEVGEGFRVTFHDSPQAALQVIHLLIASGVTVGVMMIAFLVWGKIIKPWRQRNRNDQMVDLSYRFPEGGSVSSECRATPASVIANLEVFEYKSSGEKTSCAICITEFTDGNRAKRLPCGHIFHDEPCITRWLHHSSLCPLCKASVLPAEDPGQHVQNDTTNNGSLMVLSRNPSSSTGGDVSSGSTELLDVDVAHIGGQDSPKRTALMTVGSDSIIRRHPTVSSIAEETDEGSLGMTSRGRTDFVPEQMPQQGSVQWIQMRTEGDTAESGSYQ